MGGVPQLLGLVDGDEWDAGRGALEEIKEGVDGPDERR
jgi:hypothetical protein